MCLYSFIVLQRRGIAGFELQKLGFVNYKQEKIENLGMQQTLKRENKITRR